jgi:hypothetical protein
MTDSDNENPLPGDGTVKKIKKKGEKGDFGMTLEDDVESMLSD